MDIPYDSAVALLGIYLRKLKTLFTKKLVMNVHSCFVYNSQELETPQMSSIGELLNKTQCICTVEYDCNKKGQTIDTHNSINVPDGNYAE